MSKGDKTRKRQVSLEQYENNHDRIFKKSETHITCKQMCEEISRAKILKFARGEHPTAKEVFEYSGTGELAMIPIWYEQAQEVNKIEKEQK